MNNNEELLNISYIKCPNCDENSFALEQNICLNCDYQHKILQVIKKSSNELEKNISNKIKKLIVYYQNYKSYEIEILNNKILSIKFKYSLHEKEYKFIVIIDYIIENKILKETIFQESEKEEREKTLEIKKIKKLKIKKIAQKAKVGYKEFKYSPNYFKYLRISEKEINNFIKKVLEKFHNF